MRAVGLRNQVYMETSLLYWHFVVLAAVLHIFDGVVKRIVYSSSRLVTLDLLGGGMWYSGCVRGRRDVRRYTCRSVFHYLVGVLRANVDLFVKTPRQPGARWG